MKKILLIFLLAFCSAAFGQSATAERNQSGAGRGDGYGAKVHDCISLGVTFSLPPGTANNLTAQYRVSLKPDGQISDVRLTRSSGNVNFDRAVETGIRRCTPFPRPYSGSYPGYIEIRYNMPIPEEELRERERLEAQKREQQQTQQREWREQQEQEQAQRKQQREKEEQQAIKEREPHRPKAQNDVVAQALNYVSGNGDDAKGETFYYPVERNNGNCIFKSTRTWLPDIDLNKGNPSAIQFFTRGDVYISRVEGLPEFGCLGCNGDRVQRAWALIYRECKGTRKAF